MKKIIGGMKMNNKLKRHKTISPKTIIFFTTITSIIVISFSISRYQTTLASQETGRVAKWDIELNTDYNDYILFENNKENEQNFTLKVKSESEVSSKYDLKINGLHKKYKVKIEKDYYSVAYNFDGNILNVETNNNTIKFDMDKENQSINVNGTDYYIEKYTTTGGTQINITNKTLGKDVVSFLIDKDEQIEVIFKNCVEFLSYGKHEDIYNLRISTNAEILPPECNIKVYALFEQID